MTKNTLKDAIIIVIGVVLLSAGVAYASTWTMPPASFPNGNVDAPINVGSTDQIKGNPANKTGGLRTGGALWSNSMLGTEGGGFFGGKLIIGSSTAPGNLQFFDGTFSPAGMVLTSDANWNASWKSPTGGSGGSSFGSWTKNDSTGNPLVKNKVYVAGSDGFVQAIGLRNNDTSHYAMLFIFSGSCSLLNLPVNYSQGFLAVSNSGFYPSGIAPIKNGDCWRVEYYNDSNASGSMVNEIGMSSIKWMPIGSGQSTPNANIGRPLPAEYPDRDNL